MRSPRARRIWGLLTARARPLPDFMIIGAQKCGTSSLFHYLSSAPDVERSARKELRYFSTRWARGILWYRSHFSLRARLPGRITGEASPNYLFHPAAPQRAAQAVPDARLIVLLRDPVDRAYSHYWHSRRRGVEDLGFAAALKAESSRLAHADPNDQASSYYRHSYLARGRYVEQLVRWLELFAANQIVVVQSERLFEHPTRVTQDICSFLRVRAPERSVDDEAKNPGRYGSPLDPVLRRSLSRYFQPYNERLYELPCVDFTWTDMER